MGLLSRVFWSSKNFFFVQLSIAAEPALVSIYRLQLVPQRKAEVLLSTVTNSLLDSLARCLKLELNSGSMLLPFPGIYVVNSALLRFTLLLSPFRDSAPYSPFVPFAPIGTQ